jgi:hypothetical protein
MSGMFCGSMTWIENRRIDHPRPNGPQLSRWALASPHDAIRSRVHSLARRRLGEPVRRGPITSVR